MRLMFAFNAVIQDLISIPTPYHMNKHAITAASVMSPNTKSHALPCGIVPPFLSLLPPAPVTHPLDVLPVGHLRQLVAI